MELIYGGQKAIKLKYNWLDWPIIHCDRHNTCLSSSLEVREKWLNEIANCSECQKIKEDHKKWQEQEKRRKEYEEQRRIKNTFFNRLKCVFSGGHTDELVGFLSEDVEVNAGSWNVTTTTKIEDCKNCGRRKFKYERW